MLNKEQGWLLFVIGATTFALTVIFGLLSKYILAMFACIIGVILFCLICLTSISSYYSEIERQAEDKRQSIVDRAGRLVKQNPVGHD